MQPMGNESHISKTGDTRQQILETAKSIILGKGFAAVGLNEILTTTGVPKGSFYHYFKSKEQFGVAMLESYFEEYLARLDDRLADDGRSASERLTTYFQNWLDSQCSETTRDKCLVVKLSAEVTDLSESMRISLKNGTDKVIARLAVLLEEGRANGEFPKSMDTQSVTCEIYYMWIGATLLTKVQRNRDALETAMRATRLKLGLN